MREEKESKKHFITVLSVTVLAIIANLVLWYLVDSQGFLAQKRAMLLTTPFRLIAIYIFAKTVWPDIEDIAKLLKNRRRCTQKTEGTVVALKDKGSGDDARVEVKVQYQAGEKTRSAKFIMTGFWDNLRHDLRKKPFSSGKKDPNEEPAKWEKGYKTDVYYDPKATTINFIPEARQIRGAIESLVFGLILFGWCAALGAIACLAGRG